MRLCRPPCAICHRRRRARNHAFPVIPAFISRHRGKLPPQFEQDAFCLCFRGPYPRRFSGVGTRSARRDCRASDYPSSTAAPASTSTPSPPPPPAPPSTPSRQPRARHRHQLQVDSLELGTAGLNLNSKFTPAAGTAINSKPTDTSLNLVSLFVNCHGRRRPKHPPPPRSYDC